MRIAVLKSRLEHGVGGDAGGHDDVVQRRRGGEEGRDEREVVCGEGRHFQ